MAFETVVIDVHKAVFYEHKQKVLKAGERNIEVIKRDAWPWLDGGYCILSSDRVDEKEDADESGPTPAPSRSPKKKRGKLVGGSHAEVGDAGDAVG